MTKINKNYSCSTFNSCNHFKKLTKCQKFLVILTTLVVSILTIGSAGFVTFNAIVRKWSKGKASPKIQQKAELILHPEAKPNFQKMIEERAQKWSLVIACNGKDYEKDKPYQGELSDFPEQLIELSQNPQEKHFPDLKKFLGIENISLEELAKATISLDQKTVEYFYQICAKEEDAEHKETIENLQKLKESQGDFSEIVHLFEEVEKNPFQEFDFAPFAKFNIQHHFSNELKKTLESNEVDQIIANSLLRKEIYKKFSLIFQELLESLTLYSEENFAEEIPNFIENRDELKRLEKKFALGYLNAPNLGLTYLQEICELANANANAQFLNTLIKNPNPLIRNKYENLKNEAEEIFKNYQERKKNIDALVLWSKKFPKIFALDQPKERENLKLKWKELWELNRKIFDNHIRNSLKCIDKFLRKQGPLSDLSDFKFLKHILFNKTLSKIISEIPENYPEHSIGNILTTRYALLYMEKAFNKIQEEIDADFIKLYEKFVTDAKLDKALDLLSKSRENGPVIDKKTLEAIQKWKRKIPEDAYSEIDELYHDKDLEKKFKELEDKGIQFEQNEYMLFGGITIGQHPVFIARDFFKHPWSDYKSALQYFPKKALEIYPYYEDLAKIRSEENTPEKTLIERLKKTLTVELMTIVFDNIESAKANEVCKIFIPHFDRNKKGGLHEFFELIAPLATFHFNLDLLYQLKIFIPQQEKVNEAFLEAKISKKDDSIQTLKAIARILRPFQNTASPFLTINNQEIPLRSNNLDDFYRSVKAWNTLSPTEKETAPGLRRQISSFHDLQSFIHRMVEKIFLLYIPNQQHRIGEAHFFFGDELLRFSKIFFGLLKQIEQETGVKPTQIPLDRLKPLVLEDPLLKEKFQKIDL